MYTAEQQQHIDGLVKEAYERAFLKAEQKYNQAMGAAAELRVRPYKEKLQEAHDRLRVMEIQNAASEAGAINSHQVAQLLDGSIKVDDSGSFSVVDEEGERRYNRDGAPLSVKDAVQVFLAENRHLVKSQPSTGAGSHGTSNQDFFGLE